MESIRADKAAKIRISAFVLTFAVASAAGARFNPELTPSAKTIASIVAHVRLPPHRTHFVLRPRRNDAAARRARRAVDGDSERGSLPDPSKQLHGIGTAEGEQMSGRSSTEPSARDIGARIELSGARPREEQAAGAIFPAAELPRRIWILWFQGFHAAPPIVRSCLDSWRRHNPDWEIVDLDERSLRDWLDPSELPPRNRTDITPAARSDIIRINLLAKHGGVWADATCFCCKPLDEWLRRCMHSGFFAFEHPGVDRILSSWFMASRRGCVLPARVRDAVNAYWRNHRFSNQHRKGGRVMVRSLSALLNQDVRTTRYWLSGIVPRALRVYPYFHFHYIFAEVIRSDAESRDIWERRYRLSANIPHRLRFTGFTSPLPPHLKRAIDNRDDPLYKLSWKRVPRDLRDTDTLGYLLRSADDPLPGTEPA
jgi:hypothetical protein